MGLFMSMLGQHQPLNQYVDPQMYRAVAGSSSESPNEQEKETSIIPLPLRNNVIISRQCLTYKRDNYVHFISKDCETSNSVTRLLVDIGAIEAKVLKSKKARLGQILTTPYKNHNIFSLVFKERYYDPLDTNTLKRTLKNLRDTLIKKNLTSIRISRRGDFTDTLDPGLLTELLVNIFSGTTIKVVMCYGKVELPTKEERQQIMEVLHDSLVGGHKGINQTYQKIRERYYWPGMRNDVLDYVRRCPSCQEKKIERIKTREPMIITDTPIEAFDKVSIDTVGKLRLTSRGNCHLLTIQCNLTKYLIAIPFPNIKALIIADNLAKYLICKFGAPRAILSDRGTSFLSEIFDNLMRIFRIHHLTTSGYHPQTNGSLERSHAPLVDFIRSYSEKYDDWDNLAPFATFTYNTSVHSATNFTPFELVFGKLARFPLRIPKEEQLRTYNVYLQDLVNRLGELQRVAGETQIANKIRSKNRYDHKVKSLNGKVGDYVWVLKEPRTSKFDSFYNKLLKIVEILGRNNVILELPNGKTIRKHTDKLKLVPPTDSSD